MTTIAENKYIKDTARSISNAIDFAREENLAIAIWRSPGEKNIQFILNFSTLYPVSSSPLDPDNAGFVFAPFQSPAPSYLIKDDLLLSMKDDGQLSINDKADYSEKTEKFLQSLDRKRNKTIQNSSPSVVSHDKDDFTSLVKKAIEKIQAGAFQKVVPSRKKEIRFHHPIDPGENFIRLTRHYPSAFVSIVYVPQAGLWMGATPELLLSVSGHSFKTVSLAGTQRYKDGMSLGNVAWTQKEIEEQALVSRYIINCFKKIRLREYEEVGPKTVVAGNLLHLKTEFKVDMEATHFPDLGEIMLGLLHPTSAICGMPLDEAQAFLKENEHYDRQYFSGYLGPANINGDTSLFVNLRCVRIEGNLATLFAGAGVTEDSVPEKEWEETEIKMNTILNIIK